MNIGERIIELRKEHGYTRDEFAKFIDIPSSTLRNYELGTREPGHPFLVQMSYIFKVSTDYLLGLTDEKALPCEIASISDTEISLIKKYRVLDDHGKKAVDTTLNNEYERCTQVNADAYFRTYDKAYDYLINSHIFAMGGINFDKMDNEKVIQWANDFYGMEQDAIKLLGEDDDESEDSN